MSHTAHIPSHRKPRPRLARLAVRAGVAGGVLSTLAMTGPASAAPASEPVTDTQEMPVLKLDVAADVSSAVTESADATFAAALDGELTAHEHAAEKSAAAEARKAKAAARAEAEAEKKAEAERKAAAERASRTSTRTKLTGNSGSGSSGSGSDSGSSDSGSSSTATGSAAAIVDFALAQVGKAYVMGATGPSAYDCSGLVQAAFRQAGISLPRTSQEQSTAGTQVSLSNLRAGDILYWGGAGSAYHVAVYIGGGKFVGAQNPSTGIVERSLSYDAPSGAVRVL
ncbi:C40 family peptidase [Streptomyces sp. NRRL S-87]|uniref:C40 family peptidase n=1 Tax=Streptomyces sp. NRRL S-87 TaxID=1463920 RepID=UPI0004C1EAA2|nr:C40 family peptidase [Streptomyces sp. NRRL S-87]